MELRATEPTRRCGLERPRRRRKTQGLGLERRQSHPGESEAGAEPLGSFGVEEEENWERREGVLPTRMMRLSGLELHLARRSSSVMSSTEGTSSMFVAISSSAGRNNGNGSTRVPACLACGVRTQVLSLGAACLPGSVRVGADRGFVLEWVW